MIEITGNLKMKKDKVIIMCKGIYDLLSGVESFGSLNAAAKNIGMAYSKAWKIVVQEPKRVKTELITTNGVHGSFVTKEGKKLMQQWKEINESWKN